MQAAFLITEAGGISFIHIDLPTKFLSLYLRAKQSYF